MPGPVQSIERAAAILRLLARGSGRLGVGEIATSLGLAKGTTHGILRTLQRVGFVEQDQSSGKYQLGATLLHLGTSYLDVNELRSRAINWADALASRSGEAVRIGTPAGRQGPGRAPRLPAGRHAAEPGRRRAAAAARDGAGQGPAGVRRRGRGRAARDRSSPPLTRRPWSPRRRSAGRSRRCASRAGPPRSRRPPGPGLDRRADPRLRRPGRRRDQHRRGGGPAVPDGRQRRTRRWSTYVQDAARVISRDLGAGAGRPARLRRRRRTGVARPSAAGSSRGEKATSIYRRPSPSPACSCPPPARTAAERLHHGRATT